MERLEILRCAQDDHFSTAVVLSMVTAWVHEGATHGELDVLRQARSELGS